MHNSCHGSRLLWVCAEINGCTTVRWPASPPPVTVKLPPESTERAAAANARPAEAAMPTRGAQRTAGATVSSRARQASRAGSRRAMCALSRGDAPPAGGGDGGWGRVDLCRRFGALQRHSAHPHSFKHTARAEALRVCSQLWKGCRARTWRAASRQTPVHARRLVQKDGPAAARPPAATRHRAAGSVG